MKISEFESVETANLVAKVAADKAAADADAAEHGSYESFAGALLKTGTYVSTSGPHPVIYRSLDGLTIQTENAVGDAVSGASRSSTPIKQLTSCTLYAMSLRNSS